MNGLATTFVGTPQLKLMAAAKEKEAAEKETQSLNEQTGSNLASHIRTVWETNRNARDSVNTRLLECLRARKGEYSPGQLAQITANGGADPVFLKLTGTKCRAAVAWLRDILLPIQDKPWEIEPTPVPTLPEDIMGSVAQSTFDQMTQMIQQGVQLSPEDQYKFTHMVKDKVLAEIQELANKSADNIELKIEDAMAEGGWSKALEEFLEDFVTYPFAVIKGPYYQTKRVLKWVNGVAVPTTEVVLCWRRVSPFDLYYSPYARTIQDGDLIERLRYTQGTLHDLIGMEGYSEQHIRAALTDYAYKGLNTYLWSDFERDYLESSSTYFKSDRTTIDALHYWGFVRGQDLIDWGYTGKIDDPLKMYPVDAILVGDHVIRAEINKNPLQQRPYHSACWDAIPGSLVGVALPEQMSDHQKIVNATARSLTTNLSIASGPQVSILTDMIAEGESITNVYPMKVWQMKSSLTGNSGKPIEFFQPEIIADQLLMVMQRFEEKADDVTNVPRYSYGNEKVGGAGSTYGGLSLLMNSAAKGIRRAIANIDLNIIQPTVYQSFLHIMTKNPDPNIRGDIKIVARGSVAVLIKEQQQANQKEFLQITSNPLDIEIVGKKTRAEILRQIADGMNLDLSTMPTPEELELAEMQEKALMQEQQKAEIAAAQGQGGGAEMQQQAMEIEQQAAQVEQQAQQVQQSEAQVQQQAKAVGTQMKALETEGKKLKQFEKQIEDQLAQIASEKIALDLQTKQSLADIEKAKLALQSEAAKLKALADKVNLIQESKKDEMAAKEPEKVKDVESNQPVIDKAIGEALSKLADVMKASGTPKSIKIERDANNKIVGATVSPTKKD